MISNNRNIRLFIIISQSFCLLVDCEKLAVWCEKLVECANYGIYQHLCVGIKFVKMLKWCIFAIAFFGNASFFSSGIYFQKIIYNQDTYKTRVTIDHSLFTI